jgi:DNA-binding SARP family transcriptional activator
VTTRGRHIEFRLLGEVELRAAGRLLDVGAPRQQAVLVALAADAGRPVSIETLIERVWADAPPVEVRNVLYSHLSRIRRLVRQATTLSGETSVRIERRHAGYILGVAPELVDLHRFRLLVGQGRDLRLADAARVDALTEALSLWRGEPFAGLDTSWITALRETLERDRFAVELDATDLWLRSGEPGWLLSGLAARAEAHPLDERVAGQMMLALYRCGRQAEALEHFHRLRRRLAEELGVDPGLELRRRYEQILTTDSTLDAPFHVPETESTAMPVPRQLPAHTQNFVGRTAELDQLTTMLDSANPPEGTVVIAAINGTAGIGKTALALHWAHHVTERFHDGQLYVNLRGFDPTGSPLSPAEVLREFFDAFEVPPGRIPTSVEAQAAFYRSLLTDRHMLVVLDNARDAEQVRPLLPASPTRLVVITSRDQLSGLVAREGARPVTLDVLTAAEARALLAGYLGSDRIGAEPEAVTEMVEHCARLPLALAVVAARASTHPRFALRVLAKELVDAHTRLDALDTGEAATSVRAVFSWSYRRLSAPARRMFRLLGLHRGPDLPLPAATQLANLPPAKAQEVLGELTRAHLLTQHTPDRYTFHDLLRAYATDLATSQDSQEDHHNALTRVFDHYLHTVTAAIDTLHFPDQLLGSDRPAPQMADPTDREDLAGHRTGQPDRDPRPDRRLRLAHPHHPPRDHGPSPLPSDRRSLFRRAGAVQPRSAGRPAHRRPRCRGPRAEQPRRRPPPAGPLPTSHRAPPGGAHHLPRERLPSRRSLRAHRPRYRHEAAGPLPAGHRTPPGRTGYLPRVR